MTTVTLLVATERVEDATLIDVLHVTTPDEENVTVLPAPARNLVVSEPTAVVTVETGDQVLLG